MKNKKIIISVVCILLGILVFVLALNRLNLLQTNPSEEQTSAKRSIEAPLFRSDDGGESKAADVSDGSTCSSSDGEQIAVTDEAEGKDPGQPVEEEEKNSVVITVPDDMEVGGF